MIKKLISEIRRRNVLPTLVPYIGLVWLLLQVVSVIVPMLHLHPLVGTASAIVLFAGFPAMLYLSWYFNFTTDGLEQIPETDGTLVPLGPKHWTGLTLTILLSGWLAYFYYVDISAEIEKQQDGLPTTFKASSIAVIPFRDQSAEQDQAYLAEGIAEELTSLLGNIDGLKVAATTSSFLLAKRALTPMEIGQRLSVETLLTGSIRVSGDSLRLRTELINSDDGMVLWSKNFTRKFTDIFELEEEIGRSVANLLQDRYLEKGQVTTEAKTASTDAFVIFLKGQEQYRLQTTESIKQARKLFEQAIALDPEYAAAYVALADTLVLLEKSNQRFGSLDTDVAVALSQQQLSKALLRNDSIARAYAVQGKIFELQQEFDQAISSYDKAISLNASLAIAYMWKYIALRDVNRHGEAFVMLEKAYELDPASNTTIYNFAYELVQRGQYDEAESLFFTLEDEFPDSPYSHVGRAHSAFVQGQLAQSAYQWLQASTMSPDNPGYKQSFISTLVTLQMPDLIRAHTDDPFYDSNLLLMQEDYQQLFEKMDFELRANPDDPWVAFEAGWYHLLVGDKTKGIELMMLAQPDISEADAFYMPLCSPAIEFAWVSQQSTSEKASQYMSRCMEQWVEAQSYDFVDSFVDYLRVRLAVLNGDTDRAIHFLHQALNNGWLEWWTQKDPLLAPLHDHAEFAPMMAQIDQRLAEERDKARALLGTIKPAAPASSK